MFLNFYAGFKFNYIHLGCIPLNKTKCVFIFRMTMDSYYKYLVWQHVGNSDKEFKKKFSYNDFRQSWLSFIELLDVDFVDGFSCNICLDYPQTVVLDAVMLGLQKSMMPVELHESSNDNSQEILSGRYSHLLDI